MSTTSPQQQAAGQTAEWQANLAQQLSGLTVPELSQILGGYTYGSYGAAIEGTLPGMLKSRDASGKMAVDRENYQKSLDQLRTGYGQAKTANREAITYGALRSGEGRRSPGAVSSAITSSALGLDRDMAQAKRNLEFQSAMASQADYNKVLQLMGQGSNTALGLASGFAGTSAAALQGMSQQSQAGSALGGAAAGASIGGSVGGGYGALAGAVVGGIGGYMSAG